MIRPMRIIMKDCSVRSGNDTIIKAFSWDSGESGNWLVTGKNGSGKSVFVAALSGSFEIIPAIGGGFQTIDAGPIAIVSFETAAALIEEERRNDDSDFVEGGIDPGRTPRAYIMETIVPDEAARYPGGADLELHPAVALCGIAAILDRGLKFLSTGEFRRTMLARALASRPALLILDEPYEGLDVSSRSRLKEYLSANLGDTRLILVQDRVDSLPHSITRVLELRDRETSFNGTLSAFNARQEWSESRDDKAEKKAVRETESSIQAVLSPASDTADTTVLNSSRYDGEILVEMRNVTVEWSGRKVLDGLSWTLKHGEHWLIRGPNGSGKTTLLELITGDNPQVFSNDVRLFGSRRGSGETIWEIKEKLGIVSYRLHTDYRALGEYSLETVLLSGLHDSIGLYLQCGEEERRLAEQWLSLTGFAGRGNTPFRDLSYGEQRAVLIARAAIKRPRILILDEPCHGLDESHRSLILALLQAIAEQGVSPLLHVTHDPSEVLPCERHVLELCPGESPMYRISVS